MMSTKHMDSKCSTLAIEIIRLFKSIIWTRNTSIGFLVQNVFQFNFLDCSKMTTLVVNGKVFTPCRCRATTAARSIHSRHFIFFRFTEHTLPSTVVAASSSSPSRAAPYPPGTLRTPPCSSTASKSEAD